MRKVTLSIIAALLTIFSLNAFATISPANAAEKKNIDADISYVCIDGTTKNNASACPEWKGTNLKTGDEVVTSTAKNVINWIIGIIGFLAVVMIIVGGFNYTLSQGDASKVKKAKDTIIYGVVGLVIALLAFAIVNLVLNQLFQ